MTGSWDDDRGKAALVDGAAVERVFRGPDGILAGGRPGATCIDPTREAVLVVAAEVWAPVRCPTSRS